MRASLLILCFSLNAMYASELTDSIDTSYALVWEASIAAAQAAYLATNDRYAQTLWSHTTPPADGNITPPDNLGSQPDDQEEGWADLMDISQAMIRVAAKSDAYVSPQGAGYRIRLRLTENGQLYERVIGYGPEATSSGWTAIVESAPID